MTSLFAVGITTPLTFAANPSLKFDPNGFSQKLVLDFSHSENLLDKKDKNLVEVLKQIAIDYGKRKLAFSEELIFTSLVSSFNPVLENTLYRHYFRFNLQSKNGKSFNCQSLVSEQLDSYSAVCYPSFKP